MSYRAHKKQTDTKFLLLNRILRVLKRREHTKMCWSEFEPRNIITYFNLIDPFNEAAYNWHSLFLNQMILVLLNFTKMPPACLTISLKFPNNIQLKLRIINERIIPNIASINFCHS